MAILISVCFNIWIFLTCCKTKNSNQCSNWITFSRTNKKSIHITVLTTQCLARLNTVRHFQQSDFYMIDEFLLFFKFSFKMIKSDASWDDIISESFCEINCVSIFSTDYILSFSGFMSMRRAPSCRCLWYLML